ncbi:MAG: FtsX-like permease family protein, partial [Lachnospiraceae bacterium]|nr:FtsX-like permease family protein [Lachnospiraceae bacterium]
MKRKALRKNTIREIKGSFGRYIAILAIVALGVGFFSGLKVTKEAMIATGDDYFRNNALYDFRLISTLGLSDEDAEEIKKLDFVKEAEGAYGTDALIQRGSKTVNAAKLLSISDTINKVILTEGRMPEAPNECLGDSDWFSSASIGEKITLPESNSESTLNSLNYTEFTVVGRCRSPLYVHFERGNTSLGNGKLSGFVYLMPEAFKSDYYSDIYVLTESGKEQIYSEAYNDGIDLETPVIEEKLEKLAADRYEDLKAVFGPYAPKPDTYVLTRNVNIGYASFENDSSIVEGIGNVFPIFFFLVAALVCMTTMNRMVEEKRTEIGVMKALGYKESLIMGKFLFYSGSAAIVGAVSGFIVGSKIFPYVIWHAYGILYNMPEIKFVINPVLATVSMIVAVICSMG